MERRELEQSMQFGCFLVFDNALRADGERSIHLINSLFPEAKRQQLKIELLSSKHRNAIAGFEHILRGIPFHYGLDSMHKMMKIKEDQSSNGCLFMSSDPRDAPLPQFTDFTIQLARSDNEPTFPVDATLRSFVSLGHLYSLGKWCLHEQLDIAKSVLLIIFSQLVGIFYMTGTPTATLSEPFLWGSI